MRLVGLRAALSIGRSRTSCTLSKAEAITSTSSSALRDPSGLEDHATHARVQRQRDSSAPVAVSSFRIVHRTEFASNW